MFMASHRLVAFGVALTLGPPALSAEPATVDAPVRVPERAPERPTAPALSGHRVTFVAGGLLLLGGAGLGYLARAEAERSRRLESARESSDSLDRARATAATANVLYAVAGVTLAYGLVLELLPEPAAEAASLTFHF